MWIKLHKMKIPSEFNKLIAFGIKAPSGHNSQPWKFRLTERSIEIHPDFEYALPAVDPSHRELYISLGCAGENICAVAPNFGFKANWSSKMNSNGVYFIIIDLVKADSKTDDSILQTVKERQSNRSIFNGKLIPKTEIDTLKSIATEPDIGLYFFNKDSAPFETLKDFILKGNQLQMNDSNFKNELISWIRFNKNHVKKTNNGLSYKVMGSPAMPRVIGKMVVKSFLKPTKQNASDTKKIDSSSHFVLLTSKNNTMSQWISLGFYLERILLKFVELGIANAYLNPPCEIDSLSEELRKSIPINNEYPTILMRIGYANSTPYSPRKAVKEVLFNE